MNIRQHVIPVTVNKVAEFNDDIILHFNHIPSSMYKYAQTNVVLEQNIHETVPIYSDAKDYITCELRSTIQHEAGHRQDELHRHEQTPDQRTRFEDYVNPSRAEPIAEASEENCIRPEQVSGEVENTSVYELFEQAKSQSNIDPTWKNDIVAVTLADNVAGQYLMKDLSADEILQAEQVGDNVYKKGNQIMVDVRKMIDPWIAETKSLPPIVQTDGVTVDPDLMRTQNDSTDKGTVPISPSVPTVPVI